MASRSGPYPIMMKFLKYITLFIVYFSIGWMTHYVFWGHTHFEPNAIAHHIFNERYHNRFGGGVIQHEKFVPFEIVKTCVVPANASFDGYVKGEDLIGNFHGDFGARDYYDGVHTILFYSSTRQIAFFHFDQKQYDLTAEFSCSSQKRVEISFEDSFRPNILVKNIHSE